MPCHQHAHLLLPCLGFRLLLLQKSMQLLGCWCHLCACRLLALMEVCWWESKLQTGCGCCFSSVCTQPNDSTSVVVCAWLVVTSGNACRVFQPLPGRRKMRCT